MSKLVQFWTRTIEECRATEMRFIHELAELQQVINFKASVAEFKDAKSFPEYVRRSLV